MRRKFVVIIIMIFTLVTASQSGVASTRVFMPLLPVSYISGADTAFFLKYRGRPVRVAIYKARQGHVRGSLLLLNGYNLPPKDWCDTLAFCQQALDSGFHLIIPDMGKSVYAQKYFPVSHASLRTYPTRQWMWDTLFPNVQGNYGLLLPSQKNYIIGISTGARGAALLAQDDTTGMFDAVALLSGDFDQTLNKKDNLIRLIYGPYAQYPQRWQSVDNVVHHLARLQLPLYIAHGMADAIVSPRHSTALASTLHAAYPGLRIQTDFPHGQGHTYSFWKGQCRKALEFFISGGG